MDNDSYRMSAIPAFRDPITFFAVHPQGAQPVWIQYTQNTIFGVPTKLPPPRGLSQITINIDTNDLDSQDLPYTVTRFNFGECVQAPTEYAVVLDKMRENVMASEMHVAIYEDKFQPTIPFSTTGNADFVMRHYLGRLKSSVEFVPDMLRAVEIIATYKNITYNPDQLQISIAVDTMIRTERAMELVQEWEEKGVFTKIFEERAQAFGKYKWVINKSMGMDGREPTFKLRIIFELGRICVGVEILSGEELHPYSNCATTSMDTALASYIPILAGVREGSFVLNFNCRIGDLLMASIYQADCYCLGICEDFNDARIVMRNRDMMDTILRTSHDRKKIVDHRDVSVFVSNKFAIDENTLTNITHFFCEVPFCWDESPNQEVAISYYDALFKFIDRLPTTAVTVLLVPGHHVNIIDAAAKSRDIVGNYEYMFEIEVSAKLVTFTEHVYVFTLKYSLEKRAQQLLNGLSTNLPSTSSFLPDIMSGYGIEQNGQNYLMNAGKI